jgi:hypothetical protein
LQAESNRGEWKNIFSKKKKQCEKLNYYFVEQRIIKVIDIIYMMAADALRWMSGMYG